MNALGMVEVYGFTTAICCADIAAKAADVKIIALDTNKPKNGDTAEVPLVMIVKMEGTVSAVEVGVSAAKAHAEEKGLYIISHIISRPGDGTEKMAYLSNIGRDRLWDDKGSAMAQGSPEVKEPAEEPKKAKPKRRGGKFTDLPEQLSAE